MKLKTIKREFKEIETDLSVEKNENQFGGDLKNLINIVIKQ